MEDSGGHCVLSDFYAGMLEKLGMFRVVAAAFDAAMRCALAFSLCLEGLGLFVSKCGPALVEESKTKQKHGVTKPCTQCVLFH